MTTIPKPRSYSAPPATINGPSAGAKQICTIVAIACITAFCIDMLSIGMPPSPLSVEWRVGFLQQLGDRSIIFLFGTSLLLYSALGDRRLTKPLSLVCLGVGVAFMLSCLLIVRDGLVLQDRAVQNITTQAEQLQTQIEESRGSAELPADVTPEQFAQAAEQVTSQAEILKQNARSGITRAGLASVGNLVVVGLSLVGLGRFGLTTARRIARG